MYGIIDLKFQYLLNIYLSFHIIYLRCMYIQYEHMLQKFLRYFHFFSVDFDGFIMRNFKESSYHEIDMFYKEECMIF